MEAADRAPGSLCALGARQPTCVPSYRSGSSAIPRKHLVLTTETLQSSNPNQLVDLGVLLDPVQIRPRTQIKRLPRNRR